LTDCCGRTWNEAYATLSLLGLALAHRELAKWIGAWITAQRRRAVWNLLCAIRLVTSEMLRLDNDRIICDNPLVYVLHEVGIWIPPVPFLDICTIRTCCSDSDDFVLLDCRLDGASNGVGCLHR